MDRGALAIVMAVQVNQPFLWLDLISKLGHNHLISLLEIVFETLLASWLQPGMHQRAHAPRLAAEHHPAYRRYWAEHLTG
ncbi:MAG: hypothetical protein JRE21_01285 [Deltaproteobacteria bacterium]|jgi:hypothetical protein|nr:hypothetical protein [Deltaproteobacteria bacterium]